MITRKIVGSIARRIVDLDKPGIGHGGVVHDLVDHDAAGDWLRLAGHSNRYRSGRIGNKCSSSVVTFHDDDVLLSFERVRHLPTGGRSPGDGIFEAINLNSFDIYGR